MTVGRNLVRARARAMFAVGSVVVCSCTADLSEATPIPRQHVAGDAAAAAPGPTLRVPVSRAFGSTRRMRPRIREGRVTTNVGCLGDLSARTLHREFGQRVGPLLGWDNAHVYPLGRGQWLWLGQDAYLDYTGRGDQLSDAERQLQNFAFVQRGRCFSIVHRGVPDSPTNFEPGVGAVPTVSFFWPLGGEVHRGRLRIFWSKTAWDPALPNPGDGLQRHPLSTWIGVYDPQTLERLSFRRAPNRGVFPQYGFAVVSQGRYTYLFGNSNMLNLSREGGFFNGPHSATRMYLARVPRGRLHVRPQYRTSRGWSDRASRALPISERFWAENTMQPRLIDGRWVAVTKVDGFWGNDIVVDVARRPWGPWRTIQRFRHRGRYAENRANSYQPILLPWKDPSGDLIVVIAENARDWLEAIAEPRLYRPAAFTIEWPSAP